MLRSNYELLRSNAQEQLCMLRSNYELLRSNYACSGANMNYSGATMIHPIAFIKAQLV
jgi:hypothetical protein